MNVLMQGIQKLQSEVETTENEVKELRALLKRGETAQLTSKNLNEVKRSYNILRNLKKNLDQL
jgi:hypothetical protein